MDKLKCKFSGEVVNGAIYRIKQHIAHIKGNAVGNVSQHPRSLAEDKAKYKVALEGGKNKKIQKSRHKWEVREEVEL